jgi:transcriptional regulator with PAS, ATPase and Fis domain
MPDTLLESELFGYKKGAFTGAYQDKPGLMEAAGDGTLFLDEIGDISTAMQVKLLRALQEKTFQPLGSNSELRLKARIITATNKDLMAMSKVGNFREDLFYRINVVRIDLPPLRQRKEDIPMLVETFISRFNHLYSNEALSMLLNHDWPGNIRELENLIERAAILCNGRTIGVANLPEELCDSPTIEEDSIKRTRFSAEAAAIQSALARNDFKIEAAARELGIHRATLYRKMKRYHIDSRPHRF